MIDQNGAAVAVFEGIRVRATSTKPSGDEGPESWRYRIDWRPAPPLPEPAEAAGVWLLLAPRDAELGDALAAQLEQLGGRCVLAYADRVDGLTLATDSDSERTVVTLDPRSDEHLARLVEVVTSNPAGSLRGVVHAWGAGLQEAGDEWPSAAVGDALQSARELVRQLSHRSVTPSAGVAFLTQSAQPVGEDRGVNAAQSPVLGFARVVRSEYPELHARLIDIDSNAIDAVIAELVAGDAETEVALRGDQRYAPRLVPAESADAADCTPIPTGPHRLRIPRAGSIDGLRHDAMQRRDPAAGQVEFEVHATGAQL